MNILFRWLNISNGYFLAKTQSMTRYIKNPKIIEEDGKFGYGLDKNGEKFKLVNVKEIRDTENMRLVKQYFFPINDNDFVVIENYFSRLSRGSDNTRRRSR